ncbi:MAG: hypothetical protein RBS07_07675 [Lentimicrobium sp.]|jgi:hypothetical protein|nr:hypothetical protein [Lentimicrobium sp.]
MEEENQKWMEYFVIISDAMSNVFKESSERHIGMDELAEGDNAIHFFHAMANAVPTHIFNKITKGSTNFMEFNHIANRLCFQFMTKKEDRT